ncbi:MAG: sugar phosphate nucleotidyltransferase, partial [Mariniphaga sp.]
MEEIYCLIMAGGSGTRFWPRSRTEKPKQYLNLFGRDSLLESTISRFSRFMDYQNIYIVSGKNQAQVLEEQTPMIPGENLIYEPVGKNTLPCIGLAAVLAEKENPDGIMVVSPSDHLVKDEGLFRETVLSAARLANEKEGIVTIGITPSYPATGYGYIQVDHELEGNEKIKQYKVKRFVEKPDHETASSYLQKG